MSSTKDNGLVRGILEKFLFIGFTVQIGFGIAWIIKNIGYVQLFGESAENVAVSGTFVCSIYTGVLYPAFLLLVRAAGMAIGFPWFSCVYIMQLAVAVLSVWVLLKAFSERKHSNLFYLWASLAITTFPFIIQNHLAILGNSFTMSFTLLEIAFTKRSWGTKSLIDGKEFSFDMGRVCLFWMLAALMEWDYLFIGAIPVIALLGRSVYILVKKNPKSAFFPVIIALLFGVLIVGLYKLTENKNEKALPTPSIEVALFDRTAWTAFIKTRERRNPYLIEQVGDEILEEAMNHRENVKLVIEPEIEKNLGKKAARKFYYYMSKDALLSYGTDIIHESWVDLAGYLMPPVVTGMLYDEDTFVSFAPRNYDIMKRNAPVLTKWFVDYSILWFGIALMEGCILWLLRFFEAMRDKKKIKASAVIIFAVMCIAIAVRNTFLGCGMYDHKLSGAVCVLWIMLMVLSVKAREKTK